MTAESGQVSRRRTRPEGEGEGDAFDVFKLEVGVSLKLSLYLQFERGPNQRSERMNDWKGRNVSQ